MDFDAIKFRDSGFFGPFYGLNSCEIIQLIKLAELSQNTNKWKSLHEFSPLIVRVASSPFILEKIQKILGQDIILWGSQFIFQKSGVKHRWHVDVEHIKWPGLTVWIGLDNLSQNTVLSIISHSHNLNVSPQEICSSKLINPHNSDLILNEARSINEGCCLVDFYPKKGQCVLWSGKTWHATKNNGGDTRLALILQYTTPNNEVLVPLSFDPPNVKWSNVGPPCALISGYDRHHLNELI